MTRDMYERAVARMRELGEVKEEKNHRPLSKESSVVARIRWGGRDEKEAARIAQVWAPVALEIGGYLTVHAFLHEQWGPEYTLSLHVSRSLEDDDYEGCPRCAG